MPDRVHYSKSVGYDGTTTEIVDIQLSDDDSFSVPEQETHNA